MDAIGSIQFYDGTIEEVVSIRAQKLELVPGNPSKLVFIGGLWTEASIELSPDNISMLRRFLAEAELQHTRAVCADATSPPQLNSPAPSQ